MITVANLPALLLSIGFEKQGERYVKTYTAFNVCLEADFANKKLIYPEIMKGRDRNTDFYKDNGQENKENFVVFECVNRLLEKGYRPENIELEKAWSLGHNAKSGRADICVTDKDDNMLCIIECKTYGKEWDKAFADTNNDGAQLFSYWQQEQATKWLVLYASDYNDEKGLRYNAPTINCTDDANIVLLAEKDASIQLYKNAHTADEKHIVWKRTYESAWQKDLIFSEDTVAYKIGVKPLLKKDLLDFTPEDKIVNRFEEILRHNNVSDKENAFNRLSAMFICKLVDEITKTDNDEVEFQYKQGTDTYETLQDRLQRLHRDGMEKFMREKIFYVDTDYPKWLFKHYTGHNREKAIADLEKTIKSLKFYSNNDFAFKDVHNEELFYQNGKILVEMVQLFEKYRIVYNGKHQFLGDLFEQLLNKGFKQDEGQFFTPTPITRFIWDCIPVTRYLSPKSGRHYPKVIDYACGAGHFLTEAVEAINYFANNDGDNSYVRDHIFGIEKDYRLARVAKIALYMNGAGEGNIIFGDGLDNTNDDRIKNSMFDILVANPPYSVKDFKQHLKLKNNEFELLDVISDSGSEIETLFVERIAQLLKPGGIAAVVLPSSILSNKLSSSIGAREQILKNFNIRGIVSLGAKAFGATNTTTVIMFLEKFTEPPKIMDLCADTVTAIFSGKDTENWYDKEILKRYCFHIGVSWEIYQQFIKMELSPESMAENNYFEAYVSAFNESKILKDIQSKASYKNKSAVEQKAVYYELLYKFVFNIEREKLFYFALVYKQQTVIVRSPADNKGQSKFLGYDWSNRKGYEGIVIEQPAGGMLYDDNNRESNRTLASAIRSSFTQETIELDEASNDLTSFVNTKDMLDFSTALFNKGISLDTLSRIRNTGKYPALKLRECVDIIGGLWTGEKQPLKLAKVIRNTNFTMSGKLNLTDVAEINVEENTFNNRRLQSGDIILEKSGGSQTQAVGRVVYFTLPDADYSFSNFTARLRVKTDKVLSEYLYLVLNEYYQRGYTFGYQNGMGGLKNLDMAKFKEIPVPVPPLDIQQIIIDECQKIDAEYNVVRMSVETYREKLEEVFNRLEVIKQ